MINKNNNKLHGCSTVFNVSWQLLLIKLLKKTRQPKECTVGGKDNARQITAVDKSFKLRRKN